MGRERRSARRLGRLADEDLMALVAAGDAAAFEVVYDRHAAAAYSLARRVCGGRAAAEEAVQEALLSVWRGASRYDRARGSVRMWILGIVRNRGIDALRRAGAHERRRVAEEGVAERLEAPERTDAQAAHRERERTVRDLLGTLPAEQSRVIELAYFGGLTHAEIAAMLGAPMGTVKGRMRLGLEKLRGHLDALEAPA